MSHRAAPRSRNFVARRSGDTVNVSLHHDEIELGTGDIIVSHLNLAKPLNLLALMNIDVPSPWTR
jgi:hypothetical protein